MDFTRWNHLVVNVHYYSRQGKTGQREQVVLGIGSNQCGKDVGAGEGYEARLKRLSPKSCRAKEKL